MYLGSQQAIYDLRFIHSLNIRFTTPDYLRNNSYRRALLSALQDLPDEPEFLLPLCQVSLELLKFSFNESQKCKDKNV